MRQILALLLAVACVLGPMSVWSSPAVQEVCHEAQGAEESPEEVFSLDRKASLEARASHRRARSLVPRTLRPQAALSHPFDPSPLLPILRRGPPTF
ncbi:MAG: hypothetical protein AB1758_13150 [Candidatus Eremiobacterota bacterium]